MIPFILSIYMLVHSWYDADCCGEGDCVPVPATDVVEIEGGWKYLPTGNEFRNEGLIRRIRPSRDRNFHVCIGKKAHDLGRSYCIYILSGA